MKRAGPPPHPERAADAAGRRLVGR